MPVHPKQYAARGRSYSGAKNSFSLKPPLLLLFYQHIHKLGSIVGQEGSIITRLCRSIPNNMPPEAGRTAVLKILSPSNHHSYWFSTSTSTMWDLYLDSKDPALHDYAGPSRTICRQRPVVQRCLKIRSPSNHHSYWFSTSTSTNGDRYLDSKDPSLHDHAGPPKTICRQRPVVQRC